MKLKGFFTSFFCWLKTTELFARPSKQLPGKWRLFEYYTEKSGALVNMKENQLKQQDVFWEIEFGEHGHFSQRSNLPTAFMENSEANQWSISKNYLTFLHPADFRKNEEFQFAIYKETLKLLKKDVAGKIELFGFFRKLKSENNN